MRFLELQQYVWLFNLIWYIEPVSVNNILKNKELCHNFNMPNEILYTIWGTYSDIVLDKRLRTTVLQTNTIYRVHENRCLYEKAFDSFSP